MSETETTLPKQTEAHLQTEELTKEEESLLALTYLNLTRACIQADRAHHGSTLHRLRDFLSPKNQNKRDLQVVCLYADGYVLETMLQNIALKIPDLRLHVVGKGISRELLKPDPETIQPERFEKRQEQVVHHMLQDGTLGEFNPAMPTLWIDSAIQYRIVEKLERVYTKVPLGEYPIFFSPLYTDYNGYPTRFKRIWSAKRLLPKNTAIDNRSMRKLTSKLLPLIEETTRLPINSPYMNEKGEVEYTHLPPGQTEEQEINKFYQATKWILKPENQDSLNRLVTIASNDAEYEKELNRIEKDLT